jgi:acyl carrier protein
MSDAPHQAARLLAGALQIDPSAVDNTTALGVTPQWDSLAHLRLILSLEDELGGRLTPQAIVAINGLEDVVSLLASED